MTKTNMISSSRSYAALRAQRSRLAAQLENVQNAVAKAAIAEALKLYDAEIAKAPAAAAKSPRIPADRKASAFRAHRTMLQAKLKGTRGSARKVILAKIEHYNELLAA